MNGTYLNGYRMPVIDIHDGVGGALVFYHLTTRLSLTPPPGQTINLGIPGYYSSSQALTSAAIDYADQFASYIPAGSASPAIVADASGIAGQG